MEKETFIFVGKFKEIILTCSSGISGGTESWERGPGGTFIPQTWLAHTDHRKRVCRFRFLQSLEKKKKRKLHNSLFQDDF